MHQHRLRVSLALSITLAMLIGSSQLAFSAPRFAATSTIAGNAYPPITARNADHLVEVAQSRAEFAGDWVWLPDSHSIFTETGILDFDGTILRTVREFPAAFLRQFTQASLYGVNANRISASGTMILGFRADEAPTTQPTVYLWRPLENDNLIAIHPFSDKARFDNIVAISADGKLVLASKFMPASSRMVMRLWDVDRDRLIMTFEDADFSADDALFSPDGSVIMITYLSQNPNPSSAQARFYDLRAGKEIQRLAGGFFNRFSYAEISSNNRYFAATSVSSSRYPGVWLWDLSSGEMIQYPPPNADLTVPGEYVGRFAFSPDGRLLIVPTTKQHHYYASGSLRVLEVATRRTVADLSTTALLPVRSIRVSPDGRWLAMGIYQDNRDLRSPIIGSLWAVDSAGTRLAATQTILPLTATADSVTPTPTPTATWTPTPIPPTGSTKLKAGDTAYVITRSAFTAATLLDLPGKTSTGGQACAPSTAVTVLAVSQNAEDVSNPVIYYEVKCTGKQGWLAEYNLTPFKRGDHVTVQPATEAAAPMYAKPDVSTKLDATCAAGTATSVLELTQSAKPELDPHVYVRLTCEGTTGYISDADLVKADS